MIKSTKKKETMIKMQKIKLIREETDADYLEAKNALDSCNNNLFLAINSIREKRKHLTRNEELFIINKLKKIMPNSSHNNNYNKKN